jgi:hypothetical protein
LQLADLICTWLLLGGQRQDVVEANPLARALLESHGWTGLVIFKLACTAVAVAAVRLVMVRRPLLGRGLLASLYLILLVVIGHSVNLLVRPNHPDTQIVEQEQARRNQLDDCLTALADYRRCRDAICRDLLAGRASLPEAVSGLKSHLREGASLLGLAGRYSLPPREDSGLLAAYLVFHAGLLSKQEPEQVDALLTQCAALYPQVTPIDGRSRTFDQPLPWLAMAAGPGA